MRTIIGSILAGWLLFVAIPLAVGAQPDDSTLVLEVLIQRAINQNPNLQASYEAWRASKTRISQAGALPDPSLNITFKNMPVNSFEFDQDPMTGKQISLTQPFPFPGELELKRTIAETDSKIALYQHQELQNQLVKKIKQDYYELYYIDRAIQTVIKNKQILKDFADIAETRYSVGKGLQQDVLRAQVELSKMIDKELKLRQQRRSIKAQINALINQPAAAPLGKPVAPENIGWEIPLDSLVNIAENQSPLLTAWQTVLERSEQKVKLAQKNQYPDFAAGLSYTQRNNFTNGMRRYDFLAASVSVQIPLFVNQKQKKRVEETRINRSSNEYRYQDVYNSVEGRLEQALSEIQKNERLIELYKTGVIPQAEESLQSSISGYQNDKVDFLSLLDSELTLFNFRLEYHRFLADYHKTIANIEALIGTEF